MVRGSNSAGYPGDSGVAKALLIGRVGFLMGLFAAGLPRGVTQALLPAAPSLMRIFKVELQRFVWMPLPWLAVLFLPGIYSAGR